MNKALNKKPVILTITDRGKEKKLLETILSVEGYTVHGIDAQEEYINKIREIKPDLILLNITE